MRVNEQRGRHTHDHNWLSGDYKAQGWVLKLNDVMISSDEVFKVDFIRFFAMPSPVHLLTSDSRVCVSKKFWACVTPARCCMGCPRVLCHCLLCTHARTHTRTHTHSLTDSVTHSVCTIYMCVSLLLIPTNYWEIYKFIVIVHYTNWWIIQQTQYTKA